MKNTSRVSQVLGFTLLLSSLASFASSEIAHIENDDLAGFLATNNGKVTVVKFEATWCAPCKECAPDYERLAMAYPEIALAKVDIDQNPGLGKQYKIKSVPTFIFFDKNGKHLPNNNVTGWNSHSINASIKSLISGKKPNAIVMTDGPSKQEPTVPVKKGPVKPAPKPMPKKETKPAPQTHDVIELKKPADFDAEIMREGKMKAVMFKSDTCPHCIEAKPKFKSMMSRNPDVAFFYVDVNNNAMDPKLTKYGVNSMPTFVIFDASGNKVTTIQGGGQANLNKVENSIKGKNSGQKAPAKMQETPAKKRMNKSKEM